jgi:hypothetical protein
MVERTIRYQPFKTTDGDYETLLGFVRKNVMLLSPDFDPPATRTPEWVEPEGERHYWTRRGWSQGDGKRGFIVTFRQTIEPRYDGIAASGVVVETYGLPAEMELMVTCERSWFEPRYLELRVAGPETAVDGVVRAFEGEFGPIAGRIPGQQELDTELIGIRSALRWQEWGAAKRRAAYILQFRPDDPEALFALGVASGATGDVQQALDLLARAVVLAPEHHDAWYNLGIAYIESGEPQKALEALERARSLSPTNPQITKQLSRARKLAEGG